MIPLVLERRIDGSTLVYKYMHYKHPLLLTKNKILDRSNAVRQRLFFVYLFGFV